MKSCQYTTLTILLVLMMGLTKISLAEETNNSTASGEPSSAPMLTQDAPTSNTNSSTITPSIYSPLTNCTLDTRIEVFTDYECKTAVPEANQDSLPNLPTNFTTYCNDITPKLLNDSASTVRQLVAAMETDPLNATQYSTFKTAIEPVLNITALGQVAGLSFNNLKDALSHFLTNQDFDKMRNLYKKETDTEFDKIKSSLSVMCGPENITISNYMKTQTCNETAISTAIAGYFDCYQFSDNFYWRITPGANMPGYADARQTFEINVANGTTQVDLRRSDVQMAISLQGAMSAIALSLVSAIFA